MSRITTNLQLRSGEVFSFPKHAPWKARVTAGVVWMTRTGAGDLIFHAGDTLVLQAGDVVEALGEEASLCGPHGFETLRAGADTRKVTEPVLGWVQRRRAALHLVT